MFPTRTAAEKRAKELKCSGAFASGQRVDALHDLRRL
jgi:hypothetical protein